MSRSNRRGPTDAAPSNKPLLIALAVILTALIVVTFLAFSGKLNKDEPDPYAANTPAPQETDAGGAAAPETPAAPEETAAPDVSAAPTPSPTPAPTPAPTPFVVIPGNYILPESAARYYTETELAGMSDRDLTLARNEIFARHGYLFTTPWIAGYFETQSWYTGATPAAQFDSAVLNSYERANIDLIVRVEAERAGG